MIEKENKIDFAQILLQARRKTLESFKNHESLELAASIKGVHFVIDKEGHTLENSLRSLVEIEGPIVWIFSNSDVAHFYHEFSPLIAEKVKAVICINRNCDEILGLFKNDVEYFADAKTMQIAINTSLSLCNLGDLVLFSPGIKSDVMGVKYEDMIEEFKNYLKLINL